MPETRGTTEFLSREYLRWRKIDFKSIVGDERIATAGTRCTGNLIAVSTRRSKMELNRVMLEQYPLPVGVTYCTFA